MTQDVNLYTTYPWLNNDFFERLLKEQMNITTGDIKVESFSLTNALAKGENYNSIMIRANIHYAIDENFNEKNNLTIIIKGGFIDSSLQEVNYIREVTINCEILHAVEKLLISIGDTTKLSAKCFEAKIRPAYFIFEDLTVLDFHNADRKIGLDFNHLKIVLIKLAKWHAATAVLGTNDASMMKCFETPLLTKDTVGFHPLFYNSLKLCANAAKNWSGYEHISKKLLNLEPTIIEKVAAVFQPTDNFNVLSHADLWVNNIMYKYDLNGQPQDVLMVDFAVCYWGSPGIDLSYLLFTSSTADVTEADWDKLVQIYWMELRKCLTALNYSKSMPTLTDIHTEILTKSMYSIIISLFLVGLRQLENTDDAHISSLLGDTDIDREFRENLTKSERYEKIIKFLLDYYDTKGLLEL